MLTVKSVVGAWEIDTVYGVVVSPSITDAGPEILTNAVWASGFVGAVSSLIVVSTELFTVLTLTSSNPPTFPSFEGL